MPESPADQQGWDDRPWWQRTLPSMLWAAAVASLVALAWPERFLATTTMVLAYLATPAGQELWLAAAPGRFGLPMAYVAVIFWAVNVSVVLFATLAIHVERLVLRLPRLGRRIARFEARVRRSRMAEAGLAIALGFIVALPIHTGGAVVGSLAGRVLGLRWHVVCITVQVAVTIRLAAAYAGIRGITWLWG